MGQGVGGRKSVVAGEFTCHNSHFDDSVRFALRIGFWGLTFAIISIALSVASLVVSILSLA